MPRRIEVTVSDNTLAELKHEIRSEVEHNFNYEKLMEYLKTTNDISFKEYIDQYGILDRIRKLEEMKVGDLSFNQKLLLGTYWLIVGLKY